MGDWNQYVYSYVPEPSLKLILSEGLYSGKALLKRPDLLKASAKGRNISNSELEKNIIEKLSSSWGRPTVLGPNILFQLIPKNAKLEKNHPLKKYNLVPIKINLTQLLLDYPDTKIYGMELLPFKGGMADKEREHYLLKTELFKFLSRSPEDLWSAYEDLDKKGLYAPNVPHASIHIKNGIIPTEYLSSMKEKHTNAFAQALMLLKTTKFTI